MKKTFNSVSAMLSRIVAGVLVLVGFGCSSEEEEPDPILCMYGTPTGTFEVKGSVTASDAPADAKIIVTHPSAPSGTFANYGEAETAKDGQYNVAGNCHYNEVKVVCLPTDPSLQADSVTVGVKYNPAEPKRDFWMDLGHADVNVDFKLKAKKAEE